MPDPLREFGASKGTQKVFHFIIQLVDEITQLIAPTAGPAVPGNILSRLLQSQPVGAGGTLKSNGRIIHGLLLKIGYLLLKYPFRGNQKRKLTFDVF
jgi:hypothetical protein